VGRVTLLAACILFSAGASVTLKLGITSIVGQLSIISLLKSPMIWFGGICYSAAFLGYIYVLRLVPLSLAQPVITAGVSIATALVATLFLRERMLPLNWAGLLLMCLGIFWLFGNLNDKKQANINKQLPSPAT